MTRLLLSLPALALVAATTALAWASSQPPRLPSPAAFATGAGHAQVPTLKVGLPSLSMFTIVYHIAQDKGFFEREPLHFRLPDFLLETAPFDLHFIIPTRADPPLALARLRARGLSPAVVYGAGGDSIAITVNPKDVTKILHSKTGHNTIFNLNIAGGENTPVMIVDWLVDPIKEHLLHADLQRIDLTKRISVKVPVHPIGEPVGVKIQGGQHEIINREIEIECLPDDIPEFFEHNVVEMKIGQALRASDIKLSESMVLLSDETLVISHVVATRTSETAAAAEAGTGAAEPEVMKKGKKEEEGAAAKKPEAKKK